MNKKLTYTIHKKTIELIHGDITKIPGDGIVNAANEALRGGGGVDGAIHRAGGPSIMEECRKYPGCPTGTAVVTTAGNLPAKKVIHTVGPVWRGGRNNEPDLLQNAYRNCLQKASENNLKVISFPSISTGIYGFPIEKASEIAIKTIIDFFQKNSIPEKVICVLFSEYDFEVYRKTIEEILLGNS